MTERPPKDLSWTRALVLVGQIGLAVVVPIVAGVFAGSYLLRRFGSVLLFVVSILLGIVAGLVAAYQLLAREIDRDR